MYCLLKGCEGESRLQSRRAYIKERAAVQRDFYTMKIWEWVIETKTARNREHYTIAIWLHAREEHHRCYLCIVESCGEIQRGKAECASCLHRSGESIWQGTKGRGLELLEIEGSQKNMWDWSTTYTKGAQHKSQCATGVIRDFEVSVRVDQGSTLSPLLFTIVMDYLTGEVRLEAPRNMMFADDVVLCMETKEEVEELLESWRRALEDQGLQVGRQKTEYLCAGGGASVTGSVKLGEYELPRGNWFKCRGLYSASKWRVRLKRSKSWLPIGLEPASHILQVGYAYHYTTGVCEHCVLDVGVTTKPEWDSWNGME